MYKLREVQLMMVSKYYLETDYFIVNIKFYSEMDFIALGQMKLIK